MSIILHSTVDVPMSLPFARDCTTSKTRTEPSRQPMAARRPSVEKDAVTVAMHNTNANRSAVQCSGEHRLATQFNAAQNNAMQCNQRSASPMPIPPHAHPQPRKDKTHSKYKNQSMEMIASPRIQLECWLGQLVLQTAALLCHNK